MSSWERVFFSRVLKIYSVLVWYRSLKWQACDLKSITCVLLMKPRSMLQIRYKRSKYRNERNLICSPLEFAFPFHLFPFHSFSSFFLLRFWPELHHKASNFFNLLLYIPTVIFIYYFRLPNLSVCLREKCLLLRCHHIMICAREKYRMKTNRTRFELENLHYSIVFRSSFVHLYVWNWDFS